MDVITLDNLILIERSKLWNEKKKLFAQSDSASDTNSQPHLLQSANHLSSLPCTEQADLKHKHMNEKRIFPNDYSTVNRSEEITFTGGSEPRMRAMVRHGEYSPLNPNFLSPGKFMLGLGEYEERRRLFMLKKKHEYKEYLSQARVLAQSRNGSPSRVQLDERERSLFNEDQRSMVSVSSKGVQVPEDLPYMEDYPNTFGKSLTVATHNNLQVIETPRSNIPVLEEVIRKELSQSVQSVPSNRTNLSLSIPNNTEDHGKPQTLDVNNSVLSESLSPRERKMADLQVSEQLSRMFLMSPNTEERIRTQPGTPDFSERRHSHSSAYKEELRQQIEEKQRIQEQLKENRRREEEAINRRVEEQQRRLREEYLKEESKRQIQMKKDYLDSADKQLESQTEVKSSCEEQVKYSDGLEQGSLDNLEQETRLPEVSCIPTDSSGDQGAQYHSNRKSDTGITPRNDNNSNHKKKMQYREKAQIAVQLPTPQHFRSRSFTVLESTVDDGSFLNSPGDTVTEHPVINCNTCNFEDSLPIPLLRPKSRVGGVPAETHRKAISSRKTVAPSQAMTKVEAKWQVPAVEKNNITRTTCKLPGGKSQQKNVLTQLGAFRRQLQLEQTQLLENEKRVKSQGIMK